MAPEVLANQHYSGKADVYSFAMVAWECTARQVPFEGLNGVQAALAVMARGARPDIPPHTPPGLAAIIRDCWVRGAPWLWQCQCLWSLSLRGVRCLLPTQPVCATCAMCCCL